MASEEALHSIRLLAPSVADTLRWSAPRTSPARTPVAAPETQPLGRLAPKGHTTLVLHVAVELTPKRAAKPKGVHGYEIWKHLGDPQPADPSGYTYVGTQTRTPFTDVFTAADAGKSVYYLLRWVSTKSQPGPWSDVITAKIPLSDLHVREVGDEREIVARGHRLGGARRDGAVEDHEGDVRPAEQARQDHQAPHDLVPGGKEAERPGVPDDDPRRQRATLLGELRPERRLDDLGQHAGVAGVGVGDPHRPRPQRDALLRAFAEVVEEDDQLGLVAVGPPDPEGEPPDGGRVRPDHGDRLVQQPRPALGCIVELGVPPGPLGSGPLTRKRGLDAGRDRPPASGQTRVLMVSGKLTQEGARSPGG